MSTQCTGARSGAQAHPVLQLRQRQRPSGAPRSSNGPRRRETCAQRRPAVLSRTPRHMHASATPRTARARRSGGGGGRPCEGVRSDGRDIPGAAAQRCGGARRGAAQAAQRGHGRGAADASADVAFWRRESGVRRQCGTAQQRRRRHRLTRPRRSRGRASCCPRAAARTRRAQPGAGSSARNAAAPPARAPLRTATAPRRAAAAPPPAQGVGAGAARPHPAYRPRLTLWARSFQRGQFRSCNAACFDVRRRY